jgi:hypothetical protein
MTDRHEQALDKAAREGYAVRCQTNGPRTLERYAADDIMARQLADTRVIVDAYLAIAPQAPVSAVPDELTATLNRLRLQAFETNAETDRAAYYKALSHAFQNGELVASPPPPAQADDGEKAKAAGYEIKEVPT